MKTAKSAPRGTEDMDYEDMFLDCVVIRFLFSHFVSMETIVRQKFCLPLKYERSCPILEPAGLFLPCDVVVDPVGVGGEQLRPFD